MKVGTGGGTARVSVAETITALWIFAHANGISLDDIIERTGGAGVTIDGVRLLNKALDTRDYSSPNDSFIVMKAAADAVIRFLMRVDGKSEWGDGTNPTDTNLFREAADRLKTDDSLEVAGVLGVIANIITERTADAGVTIDGALLKDGRFNARLSAAVDFALIVTSVIGDSNDRFQVEADGTHRWGGGGSGVDTALGREAVGELGTPDDFNVGGALDLAGDLELSEKTTVLVNGANDDIATGDETVQRLDADTNGANLLTGFAGGRAGRMILVLNIGTTDSPTLSHEDVSSVAANRLLLPLEANRTLSTSGGAWFLYDGTVSRWRMVRTI